MSTRLRIGAPKPSANCVRRRSGSCEDRRPAIGRRHKPRKGRIRDTSSWFGRAWRLAARRCGCRVRARGACRPQTTKRRCSSERLHDSKPGRLHDESQPQSELQLAAQWHTDDVLNNRSLDGDLGSGGSTPQDRANASGFRGTVAETVAINPALAISGIELINQWYYNPDYLAIMRDCANTVIGVWSESLLDRTVVVAVYGQPA